MEEIGGDRGRETEKERERKRNRGERKREKERARKWASSNPSALGRRGERVVAGESYRPLDRPLARSPVSTRDT